MAETERRNALLVGLVRWTVLNTKMFAFLVSSFGITVFCGSVHLKIRPSTAVGSIDFPADKKQKSDEFRLPILNTKCEVPKWRASEKTFLKCADKVMRQEERRMI